MNQIHRLLTALVLVTGLALGAAAFAPSSAEAAPDAPKALNTKVSKAQTFRYQYKPKSKTSYQGKMTQDMTMKGGPMGGAQTLTTVIDTVLVQEVNKVDAKGTGTIKTSYDSMNISLRQNGQEIPKEALGGELDKLKDISTITSHSPLGAKSTIKIEGAPPGQTTDPVMQDTMLGTSLIFPDKAIKVGESWTQDIPLDIPMGPMKMKLNFKTKYTFMGYSKIGKRDTAVFKNETTVILQEGAAGPVEMKVNGKGVGYIYFDQKAGVLVKSDVELDQSISMNMPSPDGQGSQGMSMETKVRANVMLK